MLSKEDKINIILETLEEAITIPTYQEEKVKEKLRKALRLIKEREANEPPG